MSKAESIHYIIRTPQLAEEMIAIIIDRGLSRRRLAREAHVSYCTVLNMFHPEYPDEVSKKRGSVVIETLVENRQQAFNLLTLAGIDVYRFKGSKRLLKLL